MTKNNTLKKSTSTGNKRTRQEYTLGQKQLNTQDIKKDTKPAKKVKLTKTEKILNDKVIIEDINEDNIKNKDNIGGDDNIKNNENNDEADEDYDDQAIWKKFNTYTDTTCWVSATKIKNYLLNDPLLDWLELYYVKKSTDKLPINIQPIVVSQKQKELDKEKNTLSVLFEMGIKFEDKVLKDLRLKFPNDIKRVMNNISDLNEKSFNYTCELLNLGTPIIEQAVLYNHSNKTFGVADILIRSDFINKIINSNNILTKEEINIKAPNLNHKYHYRVIDIKWTTQTLCADGRMIRNEDRFPAYKGQLAIYNAALGFIQGYVPPQAYILSKSWKYTECNKLYEGFNCFDTLGVIDYTNFDFKYIEKTLQAVNWIRDVRENGNKWSINYPPTDNRKELYPNMNNSYDTPFHNVKKKLSNDNHELTQIYQVSYKNRDIAHANKIYKWSDPNCTTESLGIYGPKVAPLVDGIININRNTSGIMILPTKIKNNIYNWQHSDNLDLYVDFETINGVFYNKNINLENSKETNGVIFMIGVGYISQNKWQYKTFIMDNYTKHDEHVAVDKFIKFVESLKVLFLKTNKLDKCNVNIYHWGHAENSMFKSTNARHNNIWQSWFTSVNWVDFCNVFKQEPIFIRGATKFGLKEIAKSMKNNKFIDVSWPEDGPADGLHAMIEAVNYYTFMDSYYKLSIKERLNIQDDYNKHLMTFNKIVKYNEIDCKAVYEIIKFLRERNSSNNK